jgi:hypothetical protein
MRTLTTLLATALTLSSASAFAATHTSQEKPPADSRTAPATPSPNTKYCVEPNPDEATGSRIYARECRTKADWAKRGVDIDEMQKPE